MKGWKIHLAAGGLIGLLAIVGFGREVLQHDWALSNHQLLEGAAWPLGGLAVLVAGLGALRLAKGRW